MVFEPLYLVSTAIKTHSVASLQQTTPQAAAVSEPLVPVSESRMSPPRDGASIVARARQRCVRPAEDEPRMLP